MRIILSFILFAILSLAPQCAWCLEAQAGEEEVGAIEEPASETQSTIGIGTEGYGSPAHSDRIMGREITGTRSGYLHPFLSLGGFYTDNLFQTSSDKKSDTVAVITPGVWLSLPATRQRLVDVNTMNTAPGGLALSRFQTDSKRRFQGYALYRADIREHDKYQDENHTDQRAEGSFRVSLRGGLSLEILDIYEINRDPYGTGDISTRRLDKFKSNLIYTNLSYQITPKTLLRFDYGNYSLSYDLSANKFRDRDDNSFSAFIFYRLTPKTSFFLEGERIDIDYKQNLQNDSEDTNYFVGVRVKSSKKLRGYLKFGYGEKDYDQANLNDSEEWLAEGQVDYFFTPKTSTYFKATRRVLESDSSGANNILSHRAQIGYRQRFTQKLRCELSAYITDNDYQNASNVISTSPDRDEKEYGFVAAVGFAPMRWLNISLGYEHEKRDSPISSNEYRSNSFFLRMTAAM